MGDNDLGWVIRNGDVGELKSRVEADKSLVSTLVAGRPPLCVAADYGQKDALNFLISHGADVNATDKYGITPLLSAIFEGHTECVKLLLEKGAKKTGTAPDGRSYVECAESDDIRQLLK